VDFFVFLKMLLKDSGQQGLEKAQILYGWMWL